MATKTSTDDGLALEGDVEYAGVREYLNRASTLDRAGWCEFL